MTGISRAGNDGGTGRGILVIFDTAALPGRRFYQHLVPGGHQFIHAAGQHGDAVFFCLDFAGNACNHPLRSCHNCRSMKR
jgi:hypothetical protein